MAKRYALCVFLLLASSSALRAQTAADYAVQLSATTQVSPPRITLQWKKLNGATGYTVNRKGKADASFSSIASLAATDSTYVDAGVSIDSVYEYQIVKSGGTITATGYIAAAIQAQPLHQRGYCLVLVDTLFRDSCAAEVAQLMADLRGDGWGVIRHDVRRDATAAAVRTIIQADHAARPDLKSLLLLGHIPVPYSGNMAPDGHSDHQGAWPADGYYADVDGTWSDAGVNNTAASRPQNRNIPGDGKWDQTALPSDLELQTGRIDFANMPAIARSEVQLMRSYLGKAHRYKMDSLAVMKKGVVDDNFGAFSGEAFAANAWRIFPPMVGRNNILSADFQTVLKDSAYQWAYGTGAGGYNSCNGVGVTADFNTRPVKGIFTMTFGSYFGDWDATNSFLRAPMCAPEPALAACWAGRPNWFMHHMALGESIGYSARISQNNGALYAPANHGAYYAHTALMGDPSLRTDYILQPKSLSISPVAGNGAALTWTASPDGGVAGYYVYRADTPWGSYARISGMLTATSFRDSAGTSGMKYYLVRPVKLVQTPSGGYYNLGIGIVDSANVTYPLHVAGIRSVGQISLFPNPAAYWLRAVLDCPASCTAEIAIKNMAGSTLIRQRTGLHTGSNSLSWDVAALPAGVYLLEVRAADAVLVRKWVKE